MHLNQLLSDYLLTLAGETRRCYGNILARHIAFLGQERDACTVQACTVQPGEILRWQESMRTQARRYDGHPRRPAEDGGLAEMTIYKNMRTAKAFWSWAVEWDDDLDRSPMRAIHIERPPRTPVSAKAAPLSTLQALLPVARQHPRDYALYLFLLATGCRRKSACLLTLDRLDLAKRRAEIIGKGDRLYTVPFCATTADALRAWLEVRPYVETRAVFLSLRRWQPMTPDGLGAWLHLLCQRAKVPRIGPHAIRHAVGCYHANNGEPLSLIRELFGHSDSRITLENYMPDSEDEVRAMVERGLVKLLAA